MTIKELLDDCHQKPMSATHLYSTDIKHAEAIAEYGMGRVVPRLVGTTILVLQGAYIGEFYKERSFHALTHTGTSSATSQ